MNVRSLLRSSALSALAIAAFHATVGAQEAVPPDQALASYVERLDDSFTWHERSSGALGDTRYVELIVTSQTWREIPWRHQLYIIHPSNVDPETTQALFMIHSGRWSDELERPPEGNEPLPSNAFLFAQLAEHLRTPMAVMMQVPHQPLFGGMTEDWLIAKTFQEYMDGGDADWPLLLPMVKSVVRGMDVVQEYAASEWSLGIDTFTLTGASKRGWTTWLTGAVDERATALVPMVIDVLNMGDHLAHANDVWGGFSQQIEPYTELRLHERLEEPTGGALLQIVDPYSYREQLLQPKLIINGTNDEYWPLEALNLYWKDLPGEKYVLYIPNNGHRLNDYGRVVGSVVALHQRVVEGKPMPDLDWEYHDDGNGTLELRVTSGPTPNLVRAWIAESDTADMRKAVWSPVTVPVRGGEAVHRLERSDRRYRAMFIEAEYTDGRALPVYLSTTIRMLPPLDGAEGGQEGDLEIALELDDGGEDDPQ